MNDPHLLGRHSGRPGVRTDLTAEPEPLNAVQVARIRRGYVMVVGILGLCAALLALSLLGQLLLRNFNLIGVGWTAFLMWCLWLAYQGRLWGRVVSSLMMWGSALSSFSAARSLLASDLSRAAGLSYLLLALIFLVSPLVLWFSPAVRAYFGYVSDELT